MEFIGTIMSTQMVNHNSWEQSKEQIIPNGIYYFISILVWIKATAVAWCCKFHKEEALLSVSRENIFPYHVSLTYTFI